MSGAPDGSDAIVRFRAAGRDASGTLPETEADHRAAEGIRPSRSLAVGALVVGSAALFVPLAFTRRLQDAFFLPKFCLAWGLLGVASFAVLLSDDRTKPAVTPTARLVDIAVGVHLAINVIATAASTDRRLSIFGERLQHEGLLSLVLYVAFYAVSRRVFRSPSTAHRLLVCALAGGWIVAAYGVAQRIDADPIWHGFLPEGRVFSTIGQPNALAAYLLTIVVVGIGVCSLTRSRTGRMAAIAATATGLASLLFTKSRGGLVAFAALVLVASALAILQLRRRQQWVIVLCGLFLVAGAGALPQSRDGLRDTWTKLTARAGDTGGANAGLSAQNHADLWRVAAAIVRSHPLHGTGPETFPDQFPSWSRVVLSPERVAYFDQFRVESPHNIFLHEAVGAGVPGLLTLLGVIAATLRHFAVVATRGDGDVRRRRFALVGGFVLIGHLLGNSFMSPEVTGSWLAWLLLGVLVAVTDGPNGPSRGVLTGPLRCGGSSPIVPP
ncbi:MAG TPA: O-antigen ligase family protein [Acidimicrobiales bacterium]|nr:O-antigen ligase family protein [Acidimicrobiales bacterium]